MIPARETLRAAYDAVIEQINSSRGSEQLTNTFYSKIGDAIPDSISTKWIGEQVGAPWRDWGRKVLKRPETQACLKSLDWCYVPSRGPGGAKLLRDTTGAGYTVAGALESSPRHCREPGELKDPSDLHSIP